MPIDEDTKSEAASETTSAKTLEPATSEHGHEPVTVVVGPPPAAPAGPPATDAEVDVALPASDPQPVGLALRAAAAVGGLHTAEARGFEPELEFSSELWAELMAHQLSEGLQLPSLEAQARAKPYFDRWVQTARGLGPAPSQEHRASWPVSEADVAPKQLGPPQPVAAPGNRRYPVARSLLPQVHASEVVRQEVSGEARAIAPQDAAWAQLKPKVAPTRPPAGVPSIRPAAPRRRQPADAVPQDLLQKASETALMWSEPSGGTSFRIDFADDFFRDAACIITVMGQDVLATFYVEDVSARRLLEAESRRLQDSLEARGLVHAQVRIVMGAAPQPFALDTSGVGPVT